MVDDIVTLLERLAELNKHGSLKEDEYTRAKRGLYKEKEGLVTRLEKLAELNKHGSLSEDEFTMAKWELLKKYY